jgi:hypothetical protein
MAAVDSVKGEEVHDAFTAADRWMDWGRLRALSSAIAVWIAPQEGDGSAERLTAEDREEGLGRLVAAVPVYPKVHLPGVVMKGYREPPASPKDYIFAQTTSCVSADLSTRVTPCQFGGGRFVRSAAAWRRRRPL